MLGTEESTCDFPDPSITNDADTSVRQAQFLKYQLVDQHIL